MTRYAVWALQSQAPQVTSCITSVRYIVEQITWKSFPPVYIGDMPKVFLEDAVHKATSQPLENAQRGDLVFLYGISRFRTQMIRHVWMILDSSGNFYHSMFTKTDIPAGRIHNVYDEKSWQKIATLEQVYESFDPRSM